MLFFLRCQVLCLLFMAVVSSARAPAPKLNNDLLPPFEEILVSLSLESYLKDFIKSGVTETRYLLRLSRMDFQLMEFDWQMTKEEVNALKDKIADLLAVAAIPDAPLLEPNKDREGLRYGRLYIPNAVQSLEFLMASFGSGPPLGPQQLCLAHEENIFGCGLPADNVNEYNLTGCLLIVQRGNCSFLRKAQTAFELKASGVIIVNNEDRLEPLSSGLGVLPNITDADIAALKDLPVFCLSNTSWAKLNFSLHTTQDNRLLAYTVPLKCGQGGKCEAVTPDERALASDTTWGSIKIRSGIDLKSFDFMTSTFGGILTTKQLCVHQAAPIDACTDVTEASSAFLKECSGGFATIVRRGSCSFDVKALSAEKIGSRLLIVIDSADEALQRIGGQDPLMGSVGIPSIIVTHSTGDYLLTRQERDEQVRIQLKPSTNSVISDCWVELAYMEWATDESTLLIQINNLIQKYKQMKIGIDLEGEEGEESEIMRWLERKKYMLLNEDAPNRATSFAEEL